MEDPTMRVRCFLLLVTVLTMPLSISPSCVAQEVQIVDTVRRLRYGPHNDQPPYSYSPIMGHIENNNPSAVFEELVREVEVSHWGSLQITEHYKLDHASAQPKGGFSRVEYQGRPEDGRRYLNFSYGCPFAETVADKQTIKIVLPEGSQEPSVVIPFEVKQSLEKKYSYLDVVGRTVVVLEKTNVVPELNTPFQVCYHFKPIFMLEEPVMFVSVFFLLFITSITYLHLDLSLQK